MTKEEPIDANVAKAVAQHKSDSTEQKSHGEILLNQLSHARETFHRAPLGLFMSSLAAGLEIGFSYALIASCYAFFAPLSPEVAIKFFALFYPFGFIAVVLGRSLLFTEQTSLLALPVLNHSESCGKLLKLWGVVIFGNLVGGCLFSVAMLYLAPLMHWFSHADMVAIAEHVLAPSWPVLLASAVLAGWLMGLLSWLITSAKDTLSRIILVAMITGGIAILGLHHSIVGNVEVFTGFLASPDIAFLEYVRFELLALLGNAIGGVVFVGILKYHTFLGYIE